MCWEVVRIYNRLWVAIKVDKRLRLNVLAPNALVLNSCTVGNSEIKTEANKTSTSTCIEDKNLKNNEV